MGIRNGETTVAATVSQETKDTLQQLANWEGVSLSRYIAGILTESVKTTGAVKTTSVRNCREQHGSLSVTLPPEITSHLSIEARAPIAFAPVPGGALIRPVR